MAKLNHSVHATLTLDALDAVLERESQQSNARSYLGMSALGANCERSLWYSFRFAAKSVFKADTLRRFEDGHLGEELMAARLRKLDFIELYTLGEDGKQIEAVDCNGHLKGHYDGVIRGVLEAPKAWHIWEHKSVNDKSLEKLRSMIAEHGEKATLKKWNHVYYSQAQLYMYKEQLDRHFMTVSSPGGRDYTSLRTELDSAFAKALIEKAQRIIDAQEPLVRISDDASYFECGWCDYKSLCHEQKVAAKNCRTCVSATAVDDGAWSCSRHKREITIQDQRVGCRSHLFLPALVPYADAVDASDDFVIYKKDDDYFANVTADAALLEFEVANKFTSAELVHLDKELVLDKHIDEIKRAFPGAEIVANTEDAPF
jgi:hypothetical protein